MKPINILAVLLIRVVCGAGTLTQPPKMKMTTEVPEVVATPNQLELASAP